MGRFQTFRKIGHIFQVRKLSSLIQMCLNMLFLLCYSVFTILKNILIDLKTIDNSIFMSVFCKQNNFHLAFFILLSYTCIVLVALYRSIRRAECIYWALINAKCNLQTIVDINIFFFQNDTMSVLIRDFKIGMHAMIVGHIYLFYMHTVTSLLSNTFISNTFISNSV